MVKGLSTALVVVAALTAQAQPITKLQRIGVIYAGGPYEAVVQGMRAGLVESGLTEGKHFVLHVRDTKGRRRDIEAFAKQLANERVDLLFTITTSVSLGAKAATREIPIVFYAGNDPVRAGLVESFARPGGRLTGVHHLATGLVPKRLEILRQALPKARRVIVFYDPDNSTARESMTLAREAAPKLRIELVERRVGSVEEVIAGVRALQAGEVDAYFLVGDAMVTSATPAIMDLARERMLPLIVQDLKLVEAGALAGYGADYFDVGRMAAKHVRRVLAGVKPQDLPVEMYDKVQLALNLRAAHDLGLVIPESVVMRADHVIR
jgi:putative tryptophan/tyrosine transport system substrate-binding protein